MTGHAAVTPDNDSRIPPRARILAAAGELFYRHGIRAVGVDAIAEAAGTNKMTLYRHFASKDELVAEYLRQSAHAADECWERFALAHPGDPLAQLCAWRNANTAARGAALGILIWIGFVGPAAYTTYMFEMRPKQLFAINEFYVLVGLCLMGAILGAWTRKTAA